jgi:hypothetical protein
MSRLEVPLLGKKVWATGALLLRAELDLLIRDDNGFLRPETFRVDSGTEMTSMAAARAKALDLRMPRNPSFLDTWRRSMTLSITGSSNTAPAKPTMTLPWRRFSRPPPRSRTPWHASSSRKSERTASDATFPGTGPPKGSTFKSTLSSRSPIRGPRAAFWEFVTRR